MFLRLLAAFIVIPLVELILLLRLADATSPLTTLGVVIITGIIGSMLARREGVLAWYRFRAALAEGRMPSREIQDGLMVVFAAALLLTPGLLTDTFGFILLVPVGRGFIRRYILSRYIGSIDVRVQTNSAKAESVDPRSHNAMPEIDRLHPNPRSSQPSSSGKSQTIDATSFRTKQP